MTWEIPSQDILYYVVMYKKEGLGKWSEKNISGLKGSVKCDLENLEPGNYVVQVVAVNKYGFSQASKSKTFTVVLPTPGKGINYVFLEFNHMFRNAIPFLHWEILLQIVQN